MNHPPKIKVGQLVYTVTSTKAAIDAACRTEQQDLYGCTDHGVLTITVDPSQAPARLRDTLLHEVLGTVSLGGPINMRPGHGARHALRGH